MTKRSRNTIYLLATLCLLLIAADGFAQKSNASQHNKHQAIALKRIVPQAFKAVHDGWSSDEVILQQELNESFLKACNKLLAETGSSTTDPIEASAADLNWMLMNLRKAGRLKSKTTRRSKIDMSAAEHVAEIASRSVIDAHQCSIDRIMCDPDLRKQFDTTAKQIDQKADAYAIRKAAFQLRKARRLKPELIGRIADWGRTITTFSIEKITNEPTSLNEHPGIYIFRDSSGYLYIGQTDNLRERLTQHLDRSHNLSLANYLKTESSSSISIEVHDFDPKSQAAKTMVRRAYESELIASRKPRFNVQP